MNRYKLSDLLDLAAIQKMADTHYQATGMPIGIIDADDGAILVGVGWQDICVTFHRANPRTLKRCQESDNYIKGNLVQGQACHYKCKNGLWDIGIPIIVSEHHLATMFLGQFFYEGESPERKTFIQQAEEFGFEPADYLAALDRVPVFSREKVAYILDYNKALVDFIADLAEHSLSKTIADQVMLKKQFFLKKAQEIGHIGAWDLDLEKNELTWTDETYRIFELPIGTKLNYQTLLKRIHPDDRQYAHQAWKESLKGKPYDIEHRLLIEGKVKWVRQTAELEFNEKNMCIRGTGITQDITASKQGELALRENEAQLRTLISTIPDLVWLKDPQGIFLSCNPKFERFFGAPEKEIIGKTDYDLVNKELADLFRQQDKAAIEAGRPLMNEEEVIFVDDGRKEFLETIKTPMYDSHGKLIGVLGIARDLTERRQAEKEKARIEEQFRQAQKVEAIGRLAGGVAHDLNNLLQPVLGYAELLLDGFGSDDSRKQKVEQIVQAGLRARDLVRQLLAFSRKQALEYKPVDLNNAVTGFERLLRRTIREDIEIKVILTEDIDLVMADIGQIEQVIMNLAINAADAMPEGGRLTIETLMVRLDEDYAAIHPGVKPGEHVMLAVSDTGGGMDEETRLHLFEPFYSTKGEQGTGLGLATVYGIVKQHGGNIWVYSEPGKGSTLKIYLPAAKGIPKEEETVERAALGLKGSETILLVEDNEHVRGLAHAVLEQQGYTVLVAQSGTEALTLMESHGGPVHLLLTDVIMPGMNGKELFAKASAKQPDLKVLYMSGYTDNVIAHRGVLDKDVQFIQKPFTVHGLAMKVREALK